MNGLSKIILTALFIIALVLVISQWQQHSRRTYTKRQQQQMKAIYRDIQQEMESASTSQDPMIKFQQTCYAASQIDALKRLAPEEDLTVLIGTDLDAECEQAQALQTKLWHQMKRG